MILENPSGSIPPCSARNRRLPRAITRNGCSTTRGSIGSSTAGNANLKARGEKAGITHLGIQAEDEAELADLNIRVDKAGGPRTPIGEETCCYFKMQKSWTLDPQGVPIEVFHTHDIAEEYGEGTLALLAGAMAAGEQKPAAKGGCCA